jgi:hypothetical protein
MSFGEVDTLNLLFDRLENLFNESQGYYESFLDTNNLYKQGKLSDKEFFEKLGDYVVAYSALEFLAIKVLFEMKKMLNKISGGRAVGTTQSPGLMPGIGPGMMGGGYGGITTTARSGTAQNPVGGPPSVVSARESYTQVGTLPTPDPSLVSRPRTGGMTCSSCGNDLRSNAKFCTKCGAKV